MIAPGPDRAGREPDTGRIPDNPAPMNPLLTRLQPYPFERLRALTKDVRPNPDLAPISLGIGEPKHPTPEFLKLALTSSLDGLAAYPATAGLPAMRRACAGWIERRYGVTLDADTEILPVNGSREALFSLAQTVIDPSRDRDRGGPVIVCPNPFYQIYEGSAYLSGATPVFANSDPARNFAADWSQIDDETWSRTQLLFVCSPGNPTGAVVPMEEWEQLFALSDRHGFVIASDECYSEIYFRDEPPLGALQAARRLGRGLERLVVLTSLSKRSNVPGLRSGFVAGDPALLKAFLLYRTYHGSAMSTTVQQASITAWDDEAHVVENREMYRRKFAQVTPVLAEVMDVALPDASFYLWAKVPEAVCSGSDTAFTRELLAQYNVAVLPGSYLAREAHGINPGAGRVRMALVAGVDECLEAAHRIAAFIRAHTAS